MSELKYHLGQWVKWSSKGLNEGDGIVREAIQTEEVNWYKIECWWVKEEEITGLLERTIMYVVDSRKNCKHHEFETFADATAYFVHTVSCKMAMIGSTGAPVVDSHLAAEALGIHYPTCSRCGMGSFWYPASDVWENECCCETWRDA